MKQVVISDEVMKKVLNGFILTTMFGWLNPFVGLYVSVFVKAAFVLHHDVKQTEKPDFRDFMLHLFGSFCGVLFTLWFLVLLSL